MRRSQHRCANKKSLCSLPPRLAFSPPPALAGATKPAGAPAAVPNAGPKPLLELTPAERVIDVVVATTSNLLNGCIFGGFFGFVSGVWSTRSVRAAFIEARTTGKSWAGISALYAGLQTAAKVIRRKDDRYNAMIGACGSGAAFTANKGPAAAAQGCVSFAALGYLIDTLSTPKTDDDQSDEAILNKKR